MVSKKEYAKYIKELTLKDEDRIKSLYGKHFVLSLLMLLVGILILLGEVYYFITFHYFSIGFKFVIGVALVVIGIVMYVIRHRNMKYCRDNYREKAIDFLLKDYEHWFKKEGWAMSWDFEHSQISKKYDLCSSSDCLIVNIPNEDGKASKVDLKICDLYAYNVYRDEKGNISHSKVYDGMFGCVEFPRKFKCALCIDVNYKRKGLDLENVELENIKFSKTFKVKSNDQIESRCILTPKMMEILLDLESVFKGLKVVFIDNYLYFGADDINMFELDSIKNKKIVSMFKGLYDEIDAILKVVEEIKDNDIVFKTSSKKRIKKNEE